MNRFLKILTIILFNIFLALPLFAADGWEVLPAPTSEALFSIHFTDSLNGWSCGANGTLLVTSDGGDSWQSKNLGTQNWLNQIFFSGAQHGWVAGDGGTIYHTSDGGQNWNPQFIETDGDISDILFISPTTGWCIALTSPVQVFRTTNGGTDWIPTELNTSFPAYSIFALDAQNLWICGGFYDFIGYTARSGDGGVSWSNVLPISSEPIFDLHFFDHQNGFAVGGDIDFGITAWESNSGAHNWTQIFAPLVLQPLFSLQYVTDSTAWSCGAGGRLYHYHKPTATWTGYESSTLYSIHGLHFINPDNGWICGSEGYIARYVPVITNIAETNRSLPQTKDIFSAYPNPFNSAIQFEIANAANSEIELNIYNNLGQRVFSRTKNNATMDNRIIWLGRNNQNQPLPSGTYFAEVGLISEKHDVQRQTRKIFLIK